MSDCIDEPAACRIPKEGLSRQEITALRQAQQARYDGMLASIVSACCRHIAIVVAERTRVDDGLADMIRKQEAGQ